MEELRGENIRCNIIGGRIRFLKCVLDIIEFICYYPDAKKSRRCVAKILGAIMMAGESSY